ncbi:Clp protease N-terminal domain-containing protein [Streptomyces monticola]|uniref:Clp protease N-terminal domain-containing protein n=1 Tax=Streptomyces monticola TaxID=2666263 RepID=A0ABW2JGF7_9ACTN
MFERFTQGARAAVKGAVGHCERADAVTVTEEHLLLALLDAEGTKAAFVFSALGVAERREAVAIALAEARRRGGVSPADEEALAGLGIDVGAIVSRIEEAHGEGALARDGKRRRRLTGHRPFTPGAKGVLEQSLRIALARKEKCIGDEHLLLALAARPGVVRDVLAAHGASYDAVTRVVGAG